MALNAINVAGLSSYASSELAQGRWTDDCESTCSDAEVLEVTASKSCGTPTQLIGASLQIQCITVPAQSINTFVDTIHQACIAQSVNAMSGKNRATWSYACKGACIKEHKVVRL
jgi:hypothetical protein